MTPKKRAALEREFLRAVEAMQHDLRFVVDKHAASGPTVARYALIEVLGDVLLQQDARGRADALFKLEQLGVYIAAEGQPQ